MKLRWVGFILTCFLIGATAVACTVKPASTAPVTQSSERLVEKLTLEQLTMRAAYILVGQVTSTVSEEEGEGNICTLVTLSVETVVKGESAQEVVIKVPGGEVNGHQLWVEDAPRLETGERVLVFLAENGTSLSVVGGVQGKLAVEEKNTVDGVPLTKFIDQVRDIMAK